MIITTDIKLEVGRIYSEKDFPDRLFDHWDEMISEYRFQVLRESNKEEYIESCKKEIPEHLDINNLLFYEYYYLVSTD